MKTPLKISGTIFLLLLLTLGTVPGVQAFSPSGSDSQVISFAAAEPGAKVTALLSLQVGAKLRCQQVQPTSAELSMMQARGMNTEDLEVQRVFIHLAQEPTAKQIKELEAMGITPYPDSWIPPVGEFPTGFIVADMPVDKLSALADREYVAQLDTAEQVLEPQNDLAAVKINADDVWGSGYDGTDVRVAVIDSGLDTSHPDIPAPVASKDYSNWPVLDDTIANSVTGHGTHVVGSVLGRGTQSSGATHEYKGMAPDADLIFLKIGNDTTSNASLDAMTNAIKAAVDTYEADIITMSYGGWGYYHDGTRQSSQAVDYAFSQGAVVFISAGNDGSAGEHYSGTVDAYSTTGFIQVNVTDSNGANVGLGFNLVWYDGLAESNDLKLTYYDSTQTVLGDTWAATQEESWKGTEHELSGYGPEEGSYHALPAGDLTYYVRVTNNSDSDQFFHIYFDGIIVGNVAAVEFQNADPFYTIASPADAEKAIAVGAYTTRANWTNYEGDGYTYNETLNTMASFSSRGPRVDSGAPQKPNIVAPGSALISVRDTDVYTWPGAYDARVIDNDGLNLNGSGPADYFVMQGTSMASPVAAGATALLLEAKPALKGHPADVRNLLQSTATSVDANDNIDGYGLLDIQAAIDASASDYEVDWLFMVYLDADNNLESAGIDDLNEMEVAGSTDDVKIVVEMDRAERDYDDDTTNGNWTGAKRFYVTHDADQAIINSPVISDLGEVNMGDPATLQSFIEWAIANYPAQHYALVLWNHGSGWREKENNGESVKSICVDDQAGDELTMTEVRSALNAANANTGKTLDIVGFDACLMHMVEVAYQVMGTTSRPLVDITVGSEETEPGDGWDYAATLTALIADPTMTPSELATQIVNDYVSSYSSSLDITQSAADLDYMEALVTDIDSFAQAMISATGDWSAISTARSQAQEYYYYYYIDLYHFAQLVNQNTSISQAVRDAASAVMTAVDNAVIAEGHTASVAGSHGLSIYYPETTSYYFSDYETDVLFTTDTHWDEFLYAILFTSPTDPDITVSPTSFDVTLAPDTTQDYTLTISNVGGGELTYDISDQETGGSQAQATIESTPATETGIDAAGNEAVDRPEPSTMTVPQSTGEVITSFSAPGTGPLGLAWDGEYLWNADWETEMIYKLNPSTGSVVQSFSSPGGRPFGLTYDGTYLWVAVRDDDTIYKLNPATGSVIDSIPSPGTNPEGLTWDGTYLWVAEYYDNAIYRVNPSNGSIIQSFSWIGTYTGGLAWDGSYLWHCDSDFNTIYKLSPTDGSVITSFSSPASWPAGLTWDGTYLWNSDSYEDTIYKIDVGEQSQDCSWLSEAPISGSVSAGSSDSITVTIDTTGLTAGSYSAEIIIASNDSDEASTTVPVSLEVSAGVPDISVSPTSFDVTLAPDTTQDYTLTIGNDGGSELTYDISDQETTGGQAPPTGKNSRAAAKEEMVPRSPDLVLTNSEYDMSIAVADASWIGRYTEATADEKLLLYGYPYAGSSYMTVRLDGSDYYQESTMDTYVTQTPIVNDNSITTQWSLPTDVDVSLRLTLQQDTTKYQATVTNNDTTSHEVRIRFMLDTMLAYNDGAPFIVPGVGNVTTEQEHTNPVFDYWQATDDLVSPTLTSNCTFDTSNKPYKVQFAYWWDIYDVPFDYTITAGQSITSDTAVGMYWNLGTLSAGESQDVTFYYGTAEAIIGEPEVSIVTLFTDEDSYLAEEDVTIYVDVGNGGDAALTNGIVTVDVENPEGTSVFEDSSTITVAAGAVASCNFTYTLPADAVVGEYTVTAAVYDSGETLLDEATTTFTVSSVDCSWLSEAPISGTVSAGGSDSITVTIDTAGLAEGSYSAEIIIASNDPDEASTSVPVSLQVSAAQPGVTVSIDAPATAAPDSDFTANIDISEVTDFDSCNYDVTFDAEVLRLDDVTSGLIGSTTIPVDIYNEVSPGTYSVVQNVPGMTGASGSGYLAVLHFHVVGSEGDSSTINLSDGVLSDNEAQEIAATWVGDSVDITSTTPGDANGDGMVNAIDITKVERIVVGLDTETPGADANQDGVVNALDITKIERIIVGLD